jgi:serine/threonine-protein kinase
MLRGGKPEAVLIDFGLARGFNHPLTTLNTDTADGFDSLELYHSGSQLGAYTDVYSLAATLYALLTRQEPPTAMDRNLGRLN